MADYKYNQAVMPAEQIISKLPFYKIAFSDTGCHRRLKYTIDGTQSSLCVYAIIDCCLGCENVFITELC